MNDKQKAIEKLTNSKKIDFNTLVRKFKREGIENFVVTKKEYIEIVLSMLREKDKEIDCLRNHVHYKICPNCKKEFRTKRSDTKYCKECAKTVNNKD